MKKYIVVNVDRATSGRMKYNAIIFEGLSIKKFISLPDDYTKEDFQTIIRSEESYKNGATVLYNSMGAGVILENCFIYSEKVNLDDLKNIHTYFEYAKDDLINLAANSEFDSYSKIEFKKLLNEMNSISLKSGSSGNVKLDMVSDDIDYNRAMIYLTYYASKIGEVTEASKETKRRLY